MAKDLHLRKQLAE